MDLRKLKTLIDLVSESNISELEITEADGKVRIVKAGPGPPPADEMMPAATRRLRRCRRRTARGPLPRRRAGAPAGMP
jgi:acetyl-CoA carboxylase biotin carboxyl carrier protein